ncbi:hypothetical protein [Herbidospora mongoliensis]|uniref:hypothetical protein n=1 Tax=Herbidospora mongoliensis TaxID=688067 RepID=UPI0012FCB851|nr:hypothetical protein [Herbidospora mongoliensis]
MFSEAVFGSAATWSDFYRAVDGLPTVLLLLVFMGLHAWLIWLLLVRPPLAGPWWLRPADRRAGVPDACLPGD